MLNNYTVTYYTAAFTINKASASVSAVANSKTYSNNAATDPALATTNSGFVAADLGAMKITFSARRAAGESAGPPTYLITPVASDNGTGLLNNYTVTYYTAAFTINKASASVSAVANSKTYSNNAATDPALATTNSGFVAADLGAMKITFSASRAAGESASPPTYLITPVASDNGTGLLNNYTVTYNTAAFTINKATASVTAMAATNPNTYNAETDPAATTTTSVYNTAHLGSNNTTTS